MKIIFIGPRSLSPQYGGIDTHVGGLAHYLVDKKKYDIVVYVRSPYIFSEDKSYRGIRIRRIFTIPNKYIETILYGLIATLAAIKEKPDIMHYEGASAFFSFIPYLLRIKVVSVAQGLEQERKKWGRFIRFCLSCGERLFLRYSHVLIVVSRQLEKYFKEKYNCNPKIVYIPNSLEISSPLPPFEIANYNLKKDEYILSVARLVPEKGLHYLIEAYKKINCRLKLVIAGDSPYLDRYAAELKENAAENIIFTGYITGKPLKELYSNAYLYIHPSELEGMSLALLEAMSFGRCVLASDIPENKNLVEDYGFFFKNKDANDLKEKLEQIIKNKDIVFAMGQRAKQYIRENFSWEVVGGQMEELYNSL